MTLVRLLRCREALVAITALGLMAGPMLGQDTRIRDLTRGEQDISVRLLGYGLVTGLDGTGDRVVGGFSSGHTVRSVANLLRNFGVEVPERVLRTRNVAAVLVTAEMSPYLRPGGRFELQVSSVGDAISLRGGVLWITPLVASPGSPPVASAQGSLLISQGGAASRRSALPPIETSARIPEGGLLEQPLPPVAFASTSTLIMREPDLTTAIAIADAINQAIGAGTAEVGDPGAVNLSIADSTAAAHAAVLGRIGELTVTRSRAARVIIDGRDGTVVAGGSITIGEAVVSHGGMTLTIGASDPEGTGAPGDVRIAVGASVQDVAGALHAVAAPPQAIAAVFESLKEIGAISAAVIIR